MSGIGKGEGLTPTSQSFSLPGILTKILEKKELFTLELISWGNTSLKLPVMVTLPFPSPHLLWKEIILIRKKKQS